jgi:hypothetical protein
MSEPPPSGQQPPYGQGPQQPAQQPYPQAYQQYPGQYAGQPAPQPSRPKQRAGWGAMAGLVAVLIVVTFGGHALGGTAGQIGGDVPLGEPVPVTDSVAVSLAEGWEVLGQLDTGFPGIRISNGAGFADVRVPPGSGSPEQILEFYVNQVLATQADQLSVGEATSLQLPSGAAGRVGYLGVFSDVPAPLEGEVIGIATPAGIPVVIDGWSDQGLYGGVQEQVLAMAASVVTA